LKITGQKFYRINGGSTQLEGVHSDGCYIQIEHVFKMGRRDIDNAMQDKGGPTVMADLNEEFY